MDSDQLRERNNRCKHLRHDFRGVSAADYIGLLNIKKDRTFMIVNASKSDQPGTHWLLL